MEQKTDKFPWLYLLLLSSVTFMGILSELVPSGILPQMSEDLQVPYSSIGLLISVYAIASAVGTIPLITLTMPMNRKKLLTILMVIFGVSNLIIAVSSSYLSNSCCETCRWNKRRGIMANGFCLCHASSTF